MMARGKRARGYGAGRGGGAGGIALTTTQTSKTTAPPDKAKGLPISERLGFITASTPALRPERGNAVLPAQHRQHVQVDAPVAPRITARAAVVKVHARGGGGIHQRIAALLNGSRGLQVRWGLDHKSLRLQFRSRVTAIAFLTGTGGISVKMQSSTTT